MRPLENLVRDAAAMAEGRAIPVAGPTGTLTAPEAEVARVLQVCNACRYCEGFCAVFPAMTRRLEFDRGDVHFLANLCHNCGACLHACQYAPPHEFALKVPQAMARVRVQTYADYAWPPALGVLYRRNGLVLSAALALGLALFLVLAAALKGSLWHEPIAGDFYQVFPHGLMVWIFAPVFGFAVFALAMGVRRFWQAQAPGAARGCRRRGGLARRAAPEVPGRRPRRRLQRGRRRLHPRTPANAPPDLLRFPPLLRGHGGRHGLPLRLRLDRAL